ncbi:hypothetical protein L228DRAFT_258484 [Xylona heveae TC161]|uniref:Uncharacterized protein n=1 Tax=Xylona heveae (strain CBS 132557 / TC161) TaxID=1328760 RepID=A0A165IJY5_XYLHT|nr:hypothetical protein L228DRAFT_258484 [Xylona heveae TC161]KZF25000.1 hypothetical protein L228DRAFT_258484 [Xylona heveae TC161]
MASSSAFPTSTEATAAQQPPAMDIDMDLDLGPDYDPTAMEAESMATDHQLAGETSAVEASVTQAEDAPQLTPHKIYIRGLDELSTEDLNAFSSEHFPSNAPTRIEWIDDTSANFVFPTPAIALKALVCFSLIPNEEPSSLPTSQLRPAKSLASHPESTLQVRLATVTDVKKPRAYEASRFYLMHPEHDPREYRGQKSNEGHRGDEGARRKYDGREHRRRLRQDEEHGFDVGLYDDEPRARRRRSLSSDSSPDVERRSRAAGKELFPTKQTGNKTGLLRNRSASPGWNGADDGTSHRSRHRQRSPPLSRVRDQDRSVSNRGKELFSGQGGVGTDISGEIRGRGKATATNGGALASDASVLPDGRELFPNRAGTSRHRRSGAFDAADETGDLFKGRLSSSMPRSNPNNQHSASLSFEDRVSMPASAVDSRPLEGFSFRGAAKQQQDPGMSIRGAAVVPAPSHATELFPRKLGGNSNRELFADKLEGRGGRRQRAEDMFA